MAQFTNKSERLTAVACTVVAIAILAAGVTARQKDAASTSEPAQWASDVIYQIKTVFRQDAREREARLAQVKAVMATWNASPQTLSDREKLIDWLSEVAVRSMPGSLDELPASPEFSKQELALATAPLPVGLSQQLPSLQVHSKTLFPEIAAAEVQVTPTPYDPFEVDERKNVDELAEEDVVLEQPLDLIPAEKKPDLESVAPKSTLASAPMPSSTLVSIETTQTAGSSEILTPTPAVLIVESVKVNLTELAARITGYHDELDEVETALLRANRVGLPLVSEQAQRLESMTRDYQFVRLYYESLTEYERQSVPPPRPLSVTLRKVARHLDRYEQSLNKDFLSSIDGIQSQKIAELRELLSAIRGRIGE